MIEIDRFVVTLGLDPRAFTQGQKDAVESFKKTQEGAKKAASQMEADGKQAGRFYSNIKGEALSLIAVLVGAKDIAGFIGRTVTDLSAVGRIATLMGQSAPEIQAVAMAVQRIGGDGKAAQQSMLGLAQTLQGWKLGQRPGQSFLQAFGFIGGNTNDDPLKILQKFSDFADRTKNKVLVGQVGQNLGLDPGLINEAIQGRGKLDADIAQSYKNGIPTDGDIKKVQALQTAFGNLAQSMRFAGTELVVDVADPLTDLLNAVAQITRDFPKATEIVLGLVAALVTLKGLGLTLGAARAVAGLGAGGAAASGGAPAAAASLGAAGPLAIAAATVAATQAGREYIASKGNAPSAKAGQAVENLPGGGAFGSLSGAALTFTLHRLGLDNPAAKHQEIQHIKAEIAEQQIRLSVAKTPADKLREAAKLEALAQQVRQIVGQGTQPTADAPPGARSPNVPPVRANAAVRDRGAVAEAYLQQGGFTPAQAKGIVAGLYAETAGTLSPNAKNPTSSATGLAQWLKPRQADFKATMGVDVQHADFGQQLQFVLYELQHGVMNAKTGARSLDATNAIKRQSDPAAAAYAFIHSFEAPGAVGEMADMRTAGTYLREGNQSGGVHIDSIVIQTQGPQDAKSISRGLNRELARHITGNSNNAVN